MCAQRRLRSAWASAQTDQSLRCPHKERSGYVETDNLFTNSNNAKKVHIWFLSYVHSHSRHSKWLRYLSWLVWAISGSEQILKWFPGLWYNVCEVPIIVHGGIRLKRWKTDWFWWLSGYSYLLDSHTYKQSNMSSPQSKAVQYYCFLINSPQIEDCLLSVFFDQLRTVLIPNCAANIFLWIFIYSYMHIHMQTDHCYLYIWSCLLVRCL